MKTTILILVLMTLVTTVASAQSTVLATTMGNTTTYRMYTEKQYTPAQARNQIIQNGFNDRAVRQQRAVMQYYNAMESARFYENKRRAQVAAIQATPEYRLNFQKKEEVKLQSALDYYIQKEDKEMIRDTQSKLDAVKRKIIDLQGSN